MNSSVNTIAFFGGSIRYIFQRLVSMDDKYSICVWDVLGVSVGVCVCVCVCVLVWIMACKCG